MSDTPLTSRAVRSFVIRNGRMTQGQKNALDTLMPVHGIEFDVLNPQPATHFGNSNPVWLEIGFGDGEALLHMAALLPEINFIGIEVHAPGVGHLLAGIDAQGLTNVRVMRHDAVEVLDVLAAQTLERVLVFFPDPWHKKRHHKRRIIQSETIDSIRRTLTPGGHLHCATDWQPYAEAMLEQLNDTEGFQNTSASRGYCDKPDYRPLTKFEQRGLRLGHEVADLVFQRLADR